MTIDTKALLPCPFCGGKAAIAQPIDGAYCAECSDCMASSALRYSCGDEPVPLVAEAWNSRHAADRLASLEAELVAANQKIADLRAVCNVNGDWTLRVSRLEQDNARLRGQISLAVERMTIEHNLVTAYKAGLKVLQEALAAGGGNDA